MRIFQYFYIQRLVYLKVFGYTHISVYLHIRYNFTENLRVALSAYLGISTYLHTWTTYIQICVESGNLYIHIFNIYVCKYLYIHVGDI